MLAESGLLALRGKRGVERSEENIVPGSHPCPVTLFVGKGGGNGERDCSCSWKKKMQLRLRGGGGDRGGNTLSV